MRTVPCLVLPSVFVALALGALACGGAVDSGLFDEQEQGAKGAASNDGSGEDAAPKREACTARPECAEGDIQMDGSGCGGDCYAVTTCGVTIECRPPPCIGTPCKADEFQQSTCPSGSTCRKATACGHTVYCFSECDGACPAGTAIVFSRPPECFEPVGECAPTFACGRQVWCTTPPPPPAD